MTAEHFRHSLLLFPWVEYFYCKLVPFYGNIFTFVTVFLLDLRYFRYRTLNAFGCQTLKPPFHSQMHHKH